MKAEESHKPTSGQMFDSKTIVTHIKNSRTMLGSTSAKDQAENQSCRKRHICLTLLLSFPFQENPTTSLHLSTKEETLTSHIQQIIDRLSV